uniref:Uncharacterized protein n=1 Tax=Nonomuraea gerenzanensis TaxID=93944 RepID=A0A1M4EHT8_9ACTN|nr:hypothetical protein BN4615_P7955 [Nonomuraea gerenzanensis]
MVCLVQAWTWQDRLVHTAATGLKLAWALLRGYVSAAIWLWLPAR